MFKKEHGVSSEFAGSERYWVRVFFPLENCPLFRSKIAHLLKPQTAMFPLGRSNINSLQGEKKGDRNGRLGDNKDPESKKSYHKCPRDWAS
ncbi:MAG: hypothetical protein NTV54_01135, partial [Ignavibacteriales bacterium]|nr:hypothetical protein [Ignavibacteriales bacterium]